SPTNGSSTTYSSGSIKNAHMIITFCRIPFEKWTGNHFNLFSMRNSFNNGCNRFSNVSSDRLYAIAVKRRCSYKVNSSYRIGTRSEERRVGKEGGRRLGRV